MDLQALAAKTPHLAAATVKAAPRQMAALMAPRPLPKETAAHLFQAGEALLPAVAAATAVPPHVAAHRHLLREAIHHLFPAEEATIHP